MRNTKSLSITVDYACLQENMLPNYTSHTHTHTHIYIYIYIYPYIIQLRYYYERYFCYNVVVYSNNYQY